MTPISNLQYIFEVQLFKSYCFLLQINDKWKQSDLCFSIIVHRYPINETEFNSYTYHGNAMNVVSDGEWLARKGVGRIRIFPANDISIDVFVTHTAADPDKSYNYTNEWYRIKQVEELVNTYIKKSDADIVLLGGDFNAGPDMKEGKKLLTFFQDIFINTTCVSVRSCLHNAVNETCFEP